MNAGARQSARLTRRAFLAGTALAGVTLAACSRSPDVMPRSLTDAIERTEARRPHTGQTVTAALNPRRCTVDLGGRAVDTVAYNDSVPGPVIRANVGDRLAVTVTNELDRRTSVHWHGIAMRNDMDGAAPATPDIGIGQTFTYDFTAANAGTYWAHPHTGLDADYGLYCPVLIDDPRERGAYDAEWIVVLDDWTDGVGRSPVQIFDDLSSEHMGHMSMSASSDLLGDGGDVAYPLYLVNGRVPTAPTTFSAKPGQRVRIRIINAAADTAFRVALADHPLTVTHTDGFSVDPIEVDALLIGMGERYDAVVTARDGVFPLVAVAEGKNESARALLRTGAGAVPDAGAAPAELGGRVGTAETFTATADVALDVERPDTELTAQLSGGMMRYEWAINGRPYGHHQPFVVREGQTSGLRFANSSMMWHPMHLHGHTFQVVNRDGGPGARKDTVIVLPRRSLDVTFAADNPGTWMLHCHNTYHQAAGMMTSIDYAVR